MAAITQVRHGVWGRRHGSFAGKSSAPTTPPRRILLTGRNDTAVALLGRDDTAIALAGRDDTRIALLGDPDMSIFKAVKCFQREDLVFRLTVAAGGLTGKSLALSVKRKPEDSADVFEKTTGAGSVVIVSDTVADATVLAADTDQTPGVYHYAYSRINAGEQAVLAHGTLTIEDSAAF